MKTIKSTIKSCFNIIHISEVLIYHAIHENMQAILLCSVNAAEYFVYL